MALKKTILYDWHVEHNAFMKEYSGWEMPFSYGTVEQEYAGVRNFAGIIDLCHTGRLRISGAGSVDFLQYVTTNDVEELEVGEFQDTLICNKQGGIIDFVSLFRAEDYFLMNVHPINTDIVLSWLNQWRAEFENVTVEEISMALGMICIEGKFSREILASLIGDELNSLKPNNYLITQIEGVRTLIALRNTIGDDEYQLYLSMRSIPGVWTTLLKRGEESGLIAIGLGAQELLYLEACYPTYGRELNNFTTPLEAGLGEIVRLEKKDFIGKKALLHSTTSEFTRRLVAFIMEDDAIPQRNAVVTIEDTPVGKVTSGGFSPTLRKGIGMAYVPQYKSMPDTRIGIVIDDVSHPAVIVKKPFYKRNRRTT